MQFNTLNNRDQLVLPVDCAGAHGQDCQPWECCTVLKECCTVLQELAGHNEGDWISHAHIFHTTRCSYEKTLTASFFPTSYIAFKHFPKLNTTNTMKVRPLRIPNYSSNKVSVSLANRFVIQLGQSCSFFMRTKTFKRKYFVMVQFYLCLSKEVKCSKKCEFFVNANK